MHHHQNEREEEDPAAGCRSAVTQQLAGTAKRTTESTICAAFVPLRYLSRSRGLLSRAGDPWRRKKISKTTLSHHNTRAVPLRWSRCPAHIKTSSPSLPPPSLPSPSSLHGPPRCAREQYSRGGRRYRAATGLAAAIRRCGTAGSRGRVEISGRCDASTGL